MNDNSNGFMSNNIKTHVEIEKTRLKRHENLNHEMKKSVKIKERKMIRLLKMLFGESSEGLPGRQVVGNAQEACPDVIEKTGNGRYVSDINALKAKYGDRFMTGHCIETTLQEMLGICPRERKRSDAYKGLVGYLKRNYGINLIIRSQKIKKSMKKKVFLVGKVREIEPDTIMNVQQEIQNELDSVTNERRVVFSVANPKENEFEFIFERTSLQDLVKKDKINSADADTITGTGLNGFMMPEPYPSVPFGSYFNTFIDTDCFIDSYKESARKLGASRMKTACVEITPQYAKLKLAY